jgi:phage-related holin
VAPHSSPTLVSVSFGSLKHLAQIPVDTAGVALTAAATAIAWVVGANNADLLPIVLYAMLLDLIVGGVRAVDDPLQKFSWQRMYGGIIGKLFRILLIPTASLVDQLIAMSPMPLPEGAEGAFPVVRITMFFLAAAEVTSILDKFRDGGVAPALLAEIARHLDRTKLGREPPIRRDYDVAAIVSEAERSKSTTEQIEQPRDSERRTE